MGEKIVNFSTLKCLFLILGFVPTLSLQKAEAASAKCFMHGMITPKDSTVKSSVSDMIRLHFDANNRKKCELMMRNYCIFNIIEKDYSPERLKGTFKPDVEKDKEYIYGFNSKCKLLNDDEED